MTISLFFRIHKYCLLTVNDPADIDRAEQLVAEHLIRMAHKEDLTVQWVRSAATEGPTTKEQ